MEFLLITIQFAERILTLLSSQSEAYRAKKHVDGVWLLPIGIRIRWTNSREELLASSFSLCMLASRMYIFLYLIGLILCMYLILYVCLLRFLLALNFVFSKIKMFKLLFILFVIKQLLGNLTSDIDTYTAELSIIRL